MLYQNLLIIDIILFFSLYHLLLKIFSTAYCQKSNFIKNNSNLPQLLQVSIDLIIIIFII